jgi:TPR repeat protein
VPKDYPEAVKWFRKAAEQNLPIAQNNLGLCYQNGQGVTKDYPEAVKWYRKAAEQNLAIAQVNLGFCYYNGQGVTKDYPEAVKWYRKAAELLNALPDNAENLETKANVYWNLSLSYYLHFELDRATQAFNDFLTVKEKLVGPAANSASFRSWARNVL